MHILPNSSRRRRLALSMATLALLFWLVQTPTAHADCGTPTEVDDAAELNEAIAKFNLKGSGCDYQIELTATIPLTESTTPIDNGAPTLNIEGAGFSVDGQSTGGIRVFEIVSGTVTMNAITVTGGITDFGAGILNAGDLTLNNSNVYSNSASNAGGGIFNNGLLALSNSEVISNSAQYGGGGISNNDGQTTLTDSIVHGNEADSGGGIVNFGPPLPPIVLNSASIGSPTDGHLTPGLLTLDNSDVTFNLADSGSGGGIYSQGGHVQIINQSTVGDNEANAGGGGIYNVGGLVEIIESDVISNHAIFGLGGGIDNQGGHVQITDGSTVAENVASTSGGGIYNKGVSLAVVAADVGAQNDSRLTSGLLEISDSAVISNSASRDKGGGIYNQGGHVQITDSSVIVDNTADISGGGIYNQGDVPNVGAADIGAQDDSHVAPGLLEISDSEVIRNSTSRADGGGIYNEGGQTTLTRTTVNGNFALDGGGIYNSGGQVVIINNSTVEGNDAGRNGGGIYNLYAGGSGIAYAAGVNAVSAGHFEPGTVEITDSQVISNMANNNGGGIFNGISILVDAAGGVSAASAEDGHYAQAIVTITNGLVDGNYAENDGGGIYNGFVFNYNGVAAQSTATLQAASLNDSHGPAIETHVLRSTVSNNHARDDGAGIYNEFVSDYNCLSATVSAAAVDCPVLFVYLPNPLVTVTESDVVDNVAGEDLVTASNIDDEGSNGGGIYNGYAASGPIVTDEGGKQALVELTNSTVSGNMADRRGGGIYNQADVDITAVSSAGVDSATYHSVIPAEISVTNSTVSDNGADIAGGIFNTQTIDTSLSLTRAIIEAVDIYTEAEITLVNSIVANSKMGGDCIQASGVVSGTHSLIEENDNCGLTNGQDGNITGQDPRLGPLQDNGGPTETHALLAGSPALHSGSNGLATSPSSVVVAAAINMDPLLYDQRGPGFPRIIGPAVDMGAYEFQGDIDLRLQKFVKPDGDIEVGEPFTFIVFIDNLTLAMAEDLVMEDTVWSNGEFTVLSINGAPGDCDPHPANPVSSFTFRCTLAELPANQRWTIHMQVVANEPMDINNEARVWTEVQVDSDPSNNSDDAAMKVRNPDDPESGLTVLKTVSVDQPVTGELHYYTIEVTNHEPTIMSSVAITDDMTGTVDFIVSPDAECVQTISSGQDQVVCDLGDLAPGETKSVRLYVRTKYHVRDGHISDNEVWATSTSTDENGDRYEDYDQVYMVFGNVNDVMVRKFGKPDGAAGAGETLHYTILVDNLGPGTAYNVDLKDLIASNGRYSFEAPGCSPSSGNAVGNQSIECELNRLDPGQQWTIQMSVTADDPQTVNNTADVSADGTDLDTSNNNAIVEHAIDAVANLEVRKSADKSSVDAGGSLLYTIRVKNLGPSVATNIRLIDTLPDGLTVTSVSKPENCTLDLASCNISHLDPDPNKTFEVQVGVEVDPNLPQGTELVNKVRVIGDEYDDQSSNNEHSVKTVINVDQQIEVRKTASASTVVAGTLLGYEITVKNVGGSTVQDVQIRDDLPEQLSFVAYQVSNNGGVCIGNDLFDPEVICDLGAMQPGESTIIRLITQVDPAAQPGVIRNQVLPDTRFVGGQLWADTVVTTEKSIRVEYSTSVLAVEPGEIFAYDVKVINEGSSTIGNAKATVELPDIVSYVSDTLGCGEALTDCALGNLAPGESRTFQVLVQIDESAFGSAVLSSTVTASADTSAGTVTAMARALVILNAKEPIFLPLISK